MSKIDLDFSSEINIECVARDTFNLDLEIKNEDNSDYKFISETPFLNVIQDFALSGTNLCFSDGEYVLFTVLDFEKEPVLICYSRNDASSIDHKSFSLPSYVSTEYPYEATESLIQVNSVNENGLVTKKDFTFRSRSSKRLHEEMHGYAIANTINSEKIVINAAFNGTNYVTYPNNYIHVTKNINSISYSFLEESYKAFEPCITLSDGNIKIKIQSYFFNLPEGKYKYNIKVVSDLDEQSTSIPKNSKFKNVKTWLEGSLTVKKQ